MSAIPVQSIHGRFVSNNNKSTKRALVRINGKTYQVVPNDQKEAIKIIDFDRSELTCSYNNQIMKIKK